MGTHIKTTTEIADPLFSETRRIAKRDGLTVRALVEEGLRRVIGERGHRKRFTLRNASYRGRGVHSGIVEGRWEQVRDLAYEGRGA